MNVGFRTAASQLFGNFGKKVRTGLAVGMTAALGACDSYTPTASNVLKSCTDSLEAGIKSSCDTLCKKPIDTAKAPIDTALGTFVGSIYHKWLTPGMGANSVYIGGSKLTSMRRALTNEEYSIIDGSASGAIADSAKIRTAQKIYGDTMGSGADAKQVDKEIYNHLPMSDTSSNIIRKVFARLKDKNTYFRYVNPIDGDTTTYRCRRLVETTDPSQVSLNLFDNSTSDNGGFKVTEWPRDSSISDKHDYDTTLTGKRRLIWDACLDKNGKKVYN